MAATTSNNDIAAAADGPVMSLINKRLRTLRKKLNRILTMEEAVTQGKPLNKEQEEVFRSKPSVLALIDKLEKLRRPLATALSEELQNNGTSFKNSRENETENETQLGSKRIVDQSTSGANSRSPNDPKTAILPLINLVDPSENHKIARVYDHTRDLDIIGPALV